MTNPLEPQRDDEDIAPTFGPTDAERRDLPQADEPDTSGHSLDRRDHGRDARDHTQEGGTWSRGTVFRRETRTRLELARSR